MKTRPSATLNCPNCPVESVLWNEVQDFIRRLNHQTGLTYRLPTEAEWEFAARGGNKSHGYEFSGGNILSEIAWYKLNTKDDPNPVSTKRPNELGIYDMTGNVYEWTNDWTDYYYYEKSPEVNPTGPASGTCRVFRGGAYNSAKEQLYITRQALLPTQFPITIRPLPIPTIQRPNNPCQRTTGVKYKTQSGKVNYICLVSSGGTITAGGTPTSDSVIITSNSPGAQWVKVNYSDSFGCTAAVLTKFNVMVKPATQPTIYGITSVCVNTLAMYMTEAGKLSYQWNVPTGGTIISGLGTRFIWFQWTLAGTHSVSVSYITPSGCPVLIPTIKTVQVHLLPTPSLNGPTTVCINTTYMYWTEPGMKNYHWFIGGAGGQINSGFNSYQVFVRWLDFPGPKWMTVNYKTPYNCTAPSPTRLDINAVVYDGNLLSGNVAFETDTDTWTDNIQNLTSIFTQEGNELSFGIFPNPNQGQFTLLILASRFEILTLSIFNIERKEIFQVPQIHVIGRFDLDIDLTGFPNGIYAVILKNDENQALKS